MTAFALDKDHHELPSGFWRAPAQLRAVITPDDPDVTSVQTEHVKAGLAKLMRALEATLNPEYGFRHPLEFALIERAANVIWAAVPNGDVRFVPHVTPTFDGGLLLEWDIAGLEADVFFASDGETTAEATVGGELQFDGDYREHSEDLYKLLLAAQERLY